MRMRARTKKPARSRTRRAAGWKALARRAPRIDARVVMVAVVGLLGAAAVIGAAASGLRADKVAARAAMPAVQPPPALPEASPIESATAAPEPPNHDAVQKQAMVTISGCLERDADSFRLKDTAGDGAPRARSWKSGFLRKHSAPIEVVDAANRAKLPAHVGQRVNVTGTIVDREMQVRSLQRIAPSCGVKS
jgi:hypothetical protein